MTDEELQEYADCTVRITLGAGTLTGKLIIGFAAQVAVNSPYAVRSYDVNPTTGTREERFVAIPSAEDVRAVELVDEDVAGEIEDTAEDAQTPG